MFKKSRNAYKLASNRISLELDMALSNQAIKLHALKTQRIAEQTANALEYKAEADEAKAKADLILTANPELAEWIKQAQSS